MIVLHLPVALPSQLTFDGPQTHLSAIADEDIQTVIHTVARDYGAITAFVHLHPPLSEATTDGFSKYDQEMAILKAVFLLAKHLAPSLKQIKETDRAAFLAVTAMDGYLGMGENASVSILSGGLNGLVKTLRLEWPSIFCRVVDLFPGFSPAEMADIVQAELRDPDRRIAETAWSESGRQTPVLMPTDLAPEVTAPVDRSDVFVVSGGAKGVTAACVMEMARRFQSGFILLGRSPIDFDLPDYATGPVDAAQLNQLIMNDLKARGEMPTPKKIRSMSGNILSKKEIENTLRTIEEAGGRAIYLPVNVTNQEELSQKIAAAEVQLGKVTGLIHGAGVLADKWIEQKTAEDFDRVLNVKVEGLKNLLACLPPAGLKTIVLFSSIAGYYGNKGQSDYAMANEVLNKVAHQLKNRYPELLVKSIDWGAWESGMVSPELKKRFEEAGVPLIPIDAGARLLVHELAETWSDQPQVVIGKELAPFESVLEGELRTHHVRRTLKPEYNPFLQHHRIHDQAVLPIVNGIGWIINGAEQLYPDFRVQQIEDSMVFKGLVFDGRQPEDFTLEIAEQEKSKEAISLVAEIRSQSGKMPVRHYRATLRLAPKDQPAMPPVWTEAIPSREGAEDGKKLYVDGSLFHGPYFQGIEQILSYDETGMLLACRVPEIPERDQGQFPIQGTNPYFADIQYQGMVVWVDRTYQAKSLPARTDRVTFYKEIPAGAELLVRVSIKEHSDFKMEADCTVFDRTGTVYMKTEGAKVTVSKQLQW